MLYKIKETDLGFGCYYRVEGVFIDRWFPYITYNGSNEIYYFSSKNNAENALLNKIKKERIIHEKTT